MCHEVLTQRTFLPSRAIQRGYADSAFCDACRTSSGVCACACYSIHISGEKRGAKQACIQYTLFRHTLQYQGNQYNLRLYNYITPTHVCSEQWWRKQILIGQAIPWPCSRQTGFLSVITS